MNWLLVLFGANLLTICVVFFYPNSIHTKVLSLYGSLIQLLLFLPIWIFFDLSSPHVQYNIFLFPNTNLWATLHFGIDGLSLYFVFLTLLVSTMALLSAWTIEVRVRELHLMLQSVTLFLLLVFTTQDLMVFYISFESVLIPMFFIVTVWGTRDRKIHAGYQFFLVTLVGSISLLIATIYLYNTLGSTHIYVLIEHKLSLETSRLIWLALFISFAVKVPMVPFHIWLPEAHVEAPTAGSILLAGILLKMGTYGLLKFSLPMFPEATVYFRPFVYTLCIIGIFYCALSTIRQVDIKKIIAYSSIGHMNYIVIGIMSGTLIGIEGSFILMIGHGFVSSALFLCAGSLYDRYHTRLLPYYGGLVYSMPLFSVYFLIFTLANISFPGSINFVGEFYIIAGVFISDRVVAILIAVAIILSAVYAFWLYNRVVFGPTRLPHMLNHSDLNSREIFILTILLFYTVWGGLDPAYFLNPFTVTMIPTIDKFSGL